jgi:cAMP-binding proteins - catabolite gene activator and regulatory subunit of cAMP-dependent protein kinases
MLNHLESALPQYVPELFRKYGQPRRFKAGETVFLKGDAARRVYYLESGQVCAYLLYPDGEERTLCFVGQGNLVGEEALAEPFCRIVCCDAATDLLMYEMEAGNFFRGCLENRESLPEIMEFFMKKISLLSSRIFYAQFMKNEEKLACLLYSETADASCVSYTHEQIAAVTGMSRVSATKIMNGFSEQGLITQEYRKIRVTDRPGLLAIFRAKEFY